MSLRLRINLIVGVLTLLFLAAVVGLQFRSMRDSVQEEVVAANRVAAQLLNRMAWQYASQGPRAMLLYLQGVGRVRSNDISLYNAMGEELYRSPPSIYKPGRDAPDWFDKMISPPPSVQAFEFPDGKLVVRANSSRAAIDAWDYMLVLIGAGLALVVALNGLVFWLVGRTVRPFGRIVAALDQVQAGRFDVVLPKLPGSEAAAIGAAFNRMVGMLGQHLATEKRAMRAEAQLHDSRELARWVDQQIEQERRMIARELHDELGQSVTAMRSMALSVAQRVHGIDPQAEQAARLIAEESSRLYDAMHGLIPRLAPLVLDNFGLADALGDLVERTRRSHAGVQIDLQVELPEAPIAGEAALALYRAAQEGLTNALRHGQARHVQLRLGSEGGGLQLSVCDNGRGLPVEPQPQAGAHYGLRWLAERVDALGGTLGIEPAAAGGVQLRVTLPSSNKTLETA